MHCFAVWRVNHFIDDLLEWLISACFELKVFTVDSSKWMQVWTMPIHIERLYGFSDLWYVVMSCSSSWCSSLFEVHIIL